MDVQNGKYWEKRPLDNGISDWNLNKENWLDDYAQSLTHPHRKLVLDALDEIKPNSLLELGCNVGPNIELIRMVFPGMDLSGIDVSPEAVTFAKDRLPLADFTCMDMAEISPELGKFDIVLADASLMYIPDTEIKSVIETISKITNNVIILDRFDESELGIVKNHIWARNYPKLLEDTGFTITAHKITEEEWPGSYGWKTDGWMWIGRKDEM